MSRASAAIELRAWPLPNSRPAFSPRTRRVLTRLLGALVAIEGVLALAAVSLPIST